MGLRQVARIVSVRLTKGLGGKSFVGLASRLASFGMTAVIGLTTHSPLFAVDSDVSGARIASYKTASGETFFAASIQPSADDAMLEATGNATADVVVIVDTSASQVGGFRNDSIAALRSVLESLKSTDRVRLFAGDVKATDLSGSFAATDSESMQNAIEQLRRRLPLGNTNLATLIDSVRASLVAEPEDHTRSIIYIGDGASIDATSNEHRFEGLVDALRADRISVHGIAVGPVTNIETMAILANQTGGVIGVIGSSEEGKPTVIGRQVGSSARKSAVWIKEVKLLDGMQLVQADRVPPMRVERDSILLGRIITSGVSGTIELTGETTSSTVHIAARASVGPSNPDFSFLPGLVKQSERNHGLMLASAGSPLLRMTAQMIATRAEALVRASEIALKQGNKRGAKAVAEKVLEVDPENSEAESIKKSVGQAKRLILQNVSEPFDDVFATGRR